MAQKENKKINIKVVANGKGGVGKSVTAKILATVGSDIYNEINLYEIDDNNKKGNLTSQLINHKVFKIDEKNEAIFDVSFNSDDNSVLSIIDCGGSSDSKKVLESIAKNKIEDCEFFIPTFDDEEIMTNVIDTINDIKSHFVNPKITLVLNKSKSINLDEAKKQFINVFGSEKYGYDNHFSKIEKDIDSIVIIPDTNLIFICKNLYRVELADLFQSSKDLIENINENRQKWKEESKEKGKNHYFKKMELVDFGVDLVEFINECKKTLKV